MDFFTVENLATLGTNLAIIIGAVAALIKAFQKKWDEVTSDNSGKLRGNIKIQSDFDTKMMKKLEEVREQLNADRVQIYDFHNGIHYANGRSAIRISCTYESVRYSIKAFQNTLNGIPISCLPNFITKLLEEDKFVCPDIEEIKTMCPATYEFKKRMGITGFYDLVFRNEYNEIIGFVAIQFCENNFNVDEAIVTKLVGYVETELIELMKELKKSKR